MVTVVVKDNSLQTTRVRKGLGLRQLGELAGVTYVAVSRIENGLQNPNPGTAAKICKALGVEFDDLFEIKPREV